MTAPRHTDEALRDFIVAWPSSFTLRDFMYEYYPRVNAGAARYQVVRVLRSLGYTVPESHTLNTLVTKEPARG